MKIKKVLHNDLKSKIDLKTDCQQEIADSHWQYFVKNKKRE